MELIEQIKSVLTDVIRPIVAETIRDEFKVPEPPKDRKFITLQQVEQMYQLSSSKIYRLFEDGLLPKYKQGDSTFVKPEDVERLFVQHTLAGNAVTTRKRTER